MSETWLNNFVFDGLKRKWYVNFQACIRFLVERFRRSGTFSPPSMYDWQFLSPEKFHEGKAESADAQPMPSQTTTFAGTTI